MMKTIAVVLILLAISLAWGGRRSTCILTPDGVMSCHENRDNESCEDIKADRNRLFRLYVEATGHAPAEESNKK
jgi:hypothetical protein